METSNSNNEDKISKDEIKNNPSSLEPHEKYYDLSEYDDACFMSTLINLFSLADDNNNNDDAMIIIHTLQSYSLQVIERYINLLIGFAIIHNETNPTLSTVILDFLRLKARNSLKFSHLIFFNLLSSKNNYKKYIEYEHLSKVMMNLMNEWEMPIDYTIEKSYQSLFSSYSNFDDFCKQNLVKLKDSGEYIKGGELKLQQRKNKSSKNNENDDKEKGKVIKKWEVYASEICLINDIVLLSEVLQSFTVDKRNGILSNFLKKINEEFMPIYFNYPFDDCLFNTFSNGNDVIKYMRSINMSYSFCLSTKSHVPYHIMLELSNDLKYSSTNNNASNKECIETVSTCIETEPQVKTQNDQSDNLDRLNSNNPMTQGISRFFSLTYYLNNIGSMFSCSAATTITDDKIHETTEENCIEEKGEIKTLSPDSIGLFGKVSFNQIKMAITDNGTKNIQLLPLIIKGGEDLRQDIFVSQATSLFLSIFHRANADIFLQPLQILPTGRGGLMKTIPDTTSLMKINKVNYSQFDGFSSNTYYIDPEIDQDNLTKSALRNYFIMKYGQNTIEFEKALNNFVKSLTGYSLLCYFLEIKDRNNGNILINDKGFLIHIDFGFLLGRSPGNVNLEQVPFKLTWDFVELMMGVKSKYFTMYIDSMLTGLIALRKEYKTICGFIRLFIETNADLLCFNDKENILERLEDKFFLDLTDEIELKEKVTMLVFTSLNNWRTLVYDQFQKFCVGIN